MNPRCDPRPEPRGSALIVVLAILFLVLAFMAGNDVTLRSLKRELQILERHQLEKYASPRSPAPPALPPGPPA